MRFEVPDWWLIATLVVYVVAILGIVMMIVAALQLIRVLGSLASKVRSITVKVQQLTGKVSSLTDEVKHVGKELSVKGRPIGTAATEMAETTATNIARYAPLIALTSTSLKLLSDFQNARAQKTK